MQNATALFMNVVEGKFSELRRDGVLRSSLLLGMREAYSAISSQSSTTRHGGGLACLAEVVGKYL
jgi:hypothetical protein